MSALQRVTQVQAAKARYTSELLTKQNVVACGVGYKISQGGLTDELGVVVSVTQKMPVAQLSGADVVPKELDGVTTDVIETGVFRAFQGHRGRWRPVVPAGVSLGHDQVTAGTYGCLVRRGADLFMLSNNHVMANANLARAGDAILQPGPSDGGLEGDKIAELADFVPLDFGERTASGCRSSLAKLLSLFRPTGQPDRQATLPPSGENRVDAALARPLSDHSVQVDILEIGPPQGVGEATLGTDVQKSGRTTGHTTGQIIQIDVSVQVAYGAQRAMFVDQLMAGAMSQPGDSGSAVLDMDRRVVGLLFAGSDTTTLINPIQAVLESLQIDVVTG